MNIQDASIQELLDELNKRSSKPGTGLLNGGSTKKVLAELKKNPDLSVGVVLTFGYPEEIKEETHQCRSCHELKSHDHFSYYLSRVDGYLMRSNAMCSDCAKKSNKKRKEILDKAQKAGEIPEKPKKGDICPHCGRKWYKNWHRHHDDVTEKFVGYICGLCNMSFQEQRTPKK